MTPAGAIEISLKHSGGRVRNVRMHSTRPLAATKVLQGKTPQQVLQMVPLLFSLCGNAQAYAALLACRAALGLPDEPQADAARELLLRMETLREHAWRIWLDCPPLLGRDGHKSSVAALLNIGRQLNAALFEGGEAFALDSRDGTRRVADCWGESGATKTMPGGDVPRLLGDLTALIDHELFDGSMEAFLNLTDRTRLDGNDSLAAALLNEIERNGWQALGANRIEHVPERPASEWHAALQSVDWATFVREPSWQGQCRESTPLSRQRETPLVAEIVGRYGNGLLARFVALLAEVAQIADGIAPLAAGQAHGQDGIGIGLVQAARGLLLHRVELRRGCVYDYRIVAPTEWNFHPDGVLVQGLKALDAADADDLQRRATWLIQAIDPCVAYKLILNET